MSALNVLHVVPAVAVRYGGPSAAVVGICKALHAEHVQATIVTTDADGRNRLDVPTGRLTSYDGVPAWFFERVGPDSFKWARRYGSWLRAHVADYDVVHIHGLLSYSALAAARACRRVGVPYIVRPLGTLEPWSLRRHAWRKRLLLACGGRQALMAAAAIHFTSDDEERGTRESVPGLARGAVVPLGIDDDMFADDRAPEAKDLPYVLAMSRLDPKKGLDVLIRAFHDAAPRAANWRLVIAGDGEPRYVQNLRQMAADGPAAERITFCGWVDGEARRTWLRGATLFALPSLQENFGVAVAQALAGGVAVLVTPAVGLSREIAAAGAGWVCEREAVTATLVEIFADHNSCLIRGHLARRFAEQYRWPRVAHALASLYAEHVRGAPHASMASSNAAAVLHTTGGRH